MFPICGGGNEKLSFCFLPKKPMMIAALGSLVVWGRGKRCDSFTKGTLQTELCHDMGMDLRGFGILSLPQAGGRGRVRTLSQLFLREVGLKTPRPRRRLVGTEFVATNGRAGGGGSGLRDGRVVQYAPFFLVQPPADP